MKVDLTNNEINQTQDRTEAAYRLDKQQKDSAAAEFACGYSVDFNANTFGNAYQDTELKSKEEMMLQASATDVQAQRNYMATMSASLSSDDFAKLLEEGYHPGEMEVEDLVTNLDKIKAKLAESGTTIEGFNDDLDQAELEKITGSTVLSQEIVTSLNRKDLPVTAENVQSISDALREMDQVQSLSDNMLKYLVKNQAEPTVENIYKAAFSAGDSESRQSKGYYNDNGYYAKKAETIDWDQLTDAIDKIVEESGCDADLKADAKEDAKWMIEQGMPLTANSLDRVMNYRSMIFPMKKEEVLDTITDGMAKGISPREVNLTDGKAESVRSRRILEETRLMMSIEANRSLLRKNLTIDTKALERAVMQLKEAEKELFGQALDIIQDIAEQPAESIGTAVFSVSSYTLTSLHEIGQNQKTVYEQAMQSYEAVWTAPRADMGDSIKKAFRNVDDILLDMNLDVNELNQKTMRILGYTGTEITKENFERVQEATEAVLTVIEEMTPERTLKMIRDGINPLQENLYDLRDYLKQKPDTDPSESYSEFIWKLSKNNEVTDSEREAYIGIYRLIRQIEKNDGRPIGHVVKAEESLTLENLLQAVRSHAATGMDVSVDDAFGTLSELNREGATITEQIYQAFQKVMDTSHTKEEDKAYGKELREEFVEASKVSESVVENLLESEIPVSADHLLAADYLMHQRNASAEKFKQFMQNKTSDKKEALKEKVSSLVDLMEDEKSFGDAYESMSLKAEEMVREELENSEDLADIRELRLLHKELHVAYQYARNEHYEIPMEIAGEYTGVNLKIIRGEGEAKASIRFENEYYGKVFASLGISERGIVGSVVSDKEEGTERLMSKREQFEAASNRFAESVSYLFDEKLKLDTYEAAGDRESANAAELFKIVKAFLKSL